MQVAAHRHDPARLAGIANVFERLCEASRARAPPGTVYCGSDTHGTTLSQ